jgi:CYTH domain-containing protein
VSDPTLKYAVVERERRWLLDPADPVPACDDVVDVVDRYVVGSRLRLRSMTAPDGTVVRKLGHKVRVGEGPREVACTNFYLDDVEWALLADLPARELRKRRHRLRVDGAVVAVDVFAGDREGLVLAEVDGEPQLTPAAVGLAPVAEVTADERLTGGALAAAGRADVRGVLAEHGL